MRLFVAVFPPPDMQGIARGAIDFLRAPGDGVAWVRRENLHYTLRFLGELAVEGAGLVADAVREAAGAHVPFAAALDRPGAFPDASRARVLWVGMGEGAAALCALARTLEQSLRARGLPHEDLPFTPHLTIGRSRAGADWAARLAAAPPLDARFRVDELRLVESTLAPGGSRYDVRLRAPLSGPA